MGRGYDLSLLNKHSMRIGSMIFFLTTHSLWVSGAIIVGLGSVLSMLGPVLVRRYADPNKLTANNEIAGFKFATIGVLYAVLLAFSVIVVWGKYSETEANVVQEAGAAEDIYRLSQGLGDKARADVASSLANYLKAAINDDWPSMDRGTGASARRATQRALDAVYATVVSSSGQGDSTVISEMLRQLDRITQSRRARLVSAGPVMAIPTRWSRDHYRVHVLFRHGKPAGANLHDGAPCTADFFGAADYRQH